MTGRRLTALRLALLLLLPAVAGAAGDDKPAKRDLEMGAYRCAVFLSGRYTVVGGFTLAADGTYKTKAGGSGKFARNAEKEQIDFLTGPLVDSFGRIEAEPEHDRVIVRLTQKKDARESESQKNWKSQYCSPIKE